jgi:hypothetical protein
MTKLNVNTIEFNDEDAAIVAFRLRGEYEVRSGKQTIECYKPICSYYEGTEDGDGKIWLIKVCVGDNKCILCCIS